VPFQSCNLIKKIGGGVDGVVVLFIVYDDDALFDV
jgi:hypothetical protein